MTHLSSKHHNSTAKYETAGWRMSKKRDIPRLADAVSAVMGLMMYNLGVKCMWELVVWNVPCPGHSVPSSLPVTQQESSCGQSETASLCPHTCPQKN